MSLCNLEEIHLNLASDWRALSTESVITRKSCSLYSCMLLHDLTKIHMHMTVAPDHNEDTISSLASLAILHPQLRVLNLGLNGCPRRHRMNANPHYPSIPPELVFSNKFEHLNHLSLKGKLAAPNHAVFAEFLLAHPSIRHFTLHSYGAHAPALPPNILPDLEYLEGPAELCAAICDSGATRSTLTEICGLGDPAGADRILLANLYAQRVFPKLPALQRINITFQGTISPSWMEDLGRHCPDVQSLVLRDPEWVGSEVGALIPTLFFTKPEY